MNETMSNLTSQRVKLDMIKSAMGRLPNSRGKALAYTSLEKGRMYIGEILRELGKEYPYEATKSATTAAGIQDAVDVSNKAFTMSDNEIVNLNDLRARLERELSRFTLVAFNPEQAMNVKGTVSNFALDCAISEAYKGLKEARMWLGIRLGEIRDNAKKQD